MMEISTMLPLGLALTLLLFPPLAARAAPSDAGDLDRGLRLAAEGRVAEALEAFDLFKQEHPADLRPYLLTARTLIDAGRVRDAAEELREALDNPPGDGAQALQLAELLRRSGHPVPASHVLEESRRRTSLPRDALWLLAELFLEQHRFDEALALLADLARTDADRYRLSQLRGRVLLEKNDLEEALEAFEAAAEANPRSGDAFHGLSKVSFLGNNPEAALRMSRYAVDLEPENPIFLYQLGVVLKASEQLSEAIETLERARALGADAFGITFDLGDAYRRAGRTDKAAEVLREYQGMLEARRRDQELVQLENAGSEALERERLDVARSSFLQMLDLDPDNLTAHNRLAKIHLSQGRVAQARTHLDRLLRDEDGRAEAHFLYALTWIEQRDADKALEHALKSKALRPGNPQLRNLLGNLYFARSEVDKAVVEYGAAKNLEPANPAFRANYEAARRRASH
jgi:tetratricopeptide (TPR) repeat protein